MRHRSFFLSFFLFTSIALYAQTLSLSEIMKGDEFIGHQPENHRWSIDGSTVYFDWNPKNEKGSSTYFWKKGMKSPEIFTGDEYFTQVYFDNQKEFEIHYYIKSGVLYGYDKQTKTHKKIIQSTQGISNITRSNQPNILFFQQNRNLYRLDIDAFSMIQLTNFTSSKSSETKLEDTFLSQQQKELFQFLKDQEAKKEWNKAKSENSKEAFPKEYFFDKSSIEQITPSPNGKFVTFRQSDYSTTIETRVENFITDDGYTQNSDARAKVSLNNLNSHNLGIINTEKDTIYFVSFSKLTGIKDFPKYYQEYDNLK